MVSVAAELVLFAAETPLLFRLPPRERLRVLAALALVIALGAILILFAWWGARATRRFINRGPRSGSQRPGVAVDDWARKPLHQDEASAPSHDPPE